MSYDKADLEAVVAEIMTGEGGSQESSRLLLGVVLELTVANLKLAAEVEFWKRQRDVVAKQTIGLQR